MADNNNVIQFPGRQPSRLQGTHSAVLASASSYKKFFQPKYLKIPAVLIALSLALVVVNRSLWQPTSGSQDLTSMSSERGLASVSNPVMMYRDSGKEMQLAQRLASVHVRSLASASVAKSVTPYDRFRHSVMRENYSVIQFRTSGEIQEVRLIENPDSAIVQYKEIRDRQNFLNSYGKLFVANYEQAVLKKSELVDNQIHETYVIKGPANQPAAEISFVVDREHRLLSITNSKI